MTPPVKLDCDLCGAPRATFTANGQERRRQYCLAHYTPYVNTQYHARKFRPPQAGVVRLWITPGAFVRWQGGKRKVLPLLYPERWRTLVSFYAATGWVVRKLDKTGAVLERAEIKGEMTA